MPVNFERIHFLWKLKLIYIKLVQGLFAFMKTCQERKRNLPNTVGKIFAALDFQF